MNKRENESRRHSTKKTEKTDASKNRRAYAKNQYEGDNKNSTNIDNSKSKKNNNKKKKTNKVLKGILIILVTILIVFVSIFSTYLIKAKGNVSVALKNMLKDVVGDQDPIFILVMGVSEDISAQLTDTIMLVGYNPDINQAFVLSIPRDTFVGDNESKAGGFDKINALYQKNPKRTVEAVEKITGVNINYYVTVKTSVLVKIVDTLGGIDFDVPINMDYDDSSQDLHIHLKAGPQKINGDQAEQLVRFRHNNNGTTYSAAYGDNDEGRTRTQREFLKVVMEKVISIRDIDKIKTIAKEIFDNLETDITIDKVFGYIPYAMDFNTGNLQMEQLPGETEKLNSLWFFKANKEKTKELINSYVEKLGLTEAEKKIYLKDTTKQKTTTGSKNTTSPTTNKSSNNTTSKNTTKTNTSNVVKTQTKSKNANAKNTTTSGNTSTTKNNTNKTQDNSTKNNTNQIQDNNTSTNTNKSEESNPNKPTENKTDNNTTSNAENDKSNKPSTPENTDIVNKNDGEADNTNTQKIDEN